MIAYSRFAWRYLDKEAAQLLWDELVDWVGWARYRYQLSKYIKPCWYRHGGVVEELTALMVAHNAVYSSPDTVKEGSEYVEDLTAWHTQLFWPVMHRLPAENDYSTCSATHCKYRPTRQPDIDGLTEFIAKDIELRPHRGLALSVATELAHQVTSDRDLGRASYDNPRRTRGGDG